jgi:hypothetical protein
MPKPDASSSPAARRRAAIVSSSALARASEDAGLEFREHRRVVARTQARGNPDVRLVRESKPFWENAHDRVGRPVEEQDGIDSGRCGEPPGREGVGNEGDPAVAAAPDLLLAQVPPRAHRDADRGPEPSGHADDAHALREIAVRDGGASVDERSEPVEHAALLADRLEARGGSVELLAPPVGRGPEVPQRTSAPAPVDRERLERRPSR